MANDIGYYEKKIKSALRAAGTYNKGLDMQVTALASALRTIDMCTDQINGLDEVTVLEVTRYGSKMAPHPVFKIQRDAQESVTKQMKLLGLTSALLSAGDDNDPLVDLTKAVRKAARSAVIKPVGDD